MNNPAWIDKIISRPKEPRRHPSPTPIIIVGMHRSGTSMISSMLEQAGLFMGAEKDPNHESTYFLRLNTWILAQAGARWDTPEHLSDLLANDDLSYKIIHQLRYMMSAPACVEYLGRKLFRERGDIAALPSPWGWKDPRSTLTLPLWLKVFPAARVIHVRRHGVDVAASLRQRSGLTLQQWRPHRKGLDEALVIDSARCFTLDGAFSLWEDYMKSAALHTAALANPLYSVRYEDFLAQPGVKLAELATFCGLAVPPDRIQEIAAAARAERSYAHRAHDELSRYAAAVQPVLREHGYE